MYQLAQVALVVPLVSPDAMSNWESDHAVHLYYDADCVYEKMNLPEEILHVSSISFDIIVDLSAYHALMKVIDEP